MQMTLKQDNMLIRKLGSHRREHPALLLNQEAPAQVPPLYYQHKVRDNLLNEWSPNYLAHQSLKSNTVRIV